MVEDDALVAGYREMAADLEREREAEEWCEGLIADGDASRCCLVGIIRSLLLHLGIRRA